MGGPRYPATGTGTGARWQTAGCSLGSQTSRSAVTAAGRPGPSPLRAHNPYWDTWGVTLRDPDGYRLVLSTRTWSNA